MEKASHRVHIYYVDTLINGCASNNVVNSIVPDILIEFLGSNWIQVLFPKSLIIKYVKIVDIELIS